LDEPIKNQENQVGQRSSGKANGNWNKDEKIQLTRKDAELGTYLGKLNLAKKFFKNHARGRSMIIALLKPITLPKNKHVSLFF